MVHESAVTTCMVSDAGAGLDAAWDGKQLSSAHPTPDRQPCPGQSSADPHLIANRRLWHNGQPLKFSEDLIPAISGIWSKSGAWSAEIRQSGVEGNVKIQAISTEQELLSMHWQWSGFKVKVHADGKLWQNGQELGRGVGEQGSSMV